ncbi:ATP-binding protein [Streptomyces winkii]|uniref:ATP-binding protein n=1 Tax=Streptomyces winkii TaxID=3051178 RepID=UPI0028D6A5BD|nr:ATP-binding protein [Streptomyces sp. DSM 40971]
MQVWELLCPGRPEEVSRARRWTRDVLAGCPQADDAALIVTELGTNAVTHTSSPDFRVSIRRARSTVTITVSDHGNSATVPLPTTPNAEGTHGRGLFLVTQLAARVRITNHMYGHTVAAHLAPEAPAC